MNHLTLGSRLLPYMIWYITPVLTLMYKPSKCKFSIALTLLNPQILYL